MHYLALDQDDERLIQAAAKVIEKNYREGRHTVGAAVLASSGKIYVGVNIDTCAYGPCAEPIAMGAAISSGERNLLCIVAVEGWNPSHPPMPPCGNCRQLLEDYAPDIMIILRHGGQLVKVKAADLLPNAYRSF
jgi:cytidine deaminase